MLLRRSQFDFGNTETEHGEFGQGLSRLCGFLACLLNRWMDVMTLSSNECFSIRFYISPLCAQAWQITA